ncbi:cytochrome C [Leptospira fainei serovar Hurstbridge str. BUT 6]|uniref:Cytochrome C n=1 Tax=Leptospira fainei serovar Hurstbridge str. BUT 6 TaxID=1193011 RepID=S3UZI4_9LEPT|nr:cbb3-type cytochrome c oxidase N-terminal domain-containing protein [Leptospira fainei]EPG75846.1 cytochrome C [Leptospira fainei serovar Hurstbridge str. BUT 6]
MSDPNKEFDGIKQSNNPLPAWWVWVWFGSIIFAIAYAIYFHGFSSWETKEQYETQVRDYEKEFPDKNKVIVSSGGADPFRGDAKAIAAGQITFQTYCVACHGPTGEGLVGPNLMDKEWLHGNTDAELYEEIMKGIGPDKAKLGRGPMPPHENSLGSEKVYQVIAWLASRNPSLKASK